MGLDLACSKGKAAVRTRAQSKVALKDMSLALPMVFLMGWGKTGRMAGRTEELMARCHSVTCCMKVTEMVETRAPDLEQRTV